MTADDPAQSRLQFDPAYYRREYPDLRLNDEAAHEHFRVVGWREGRNPNAAFDVVGYLLANPHVEQAGTDPLDHYVRIGRFDGIVAAAAVSPSTSTTALFGFPVTDWVARLAPYIDVRHYTGALSSADRAVIDPVAHYAFRGWRLGLDPNAAFITRLWLARHPTESRAFVNPLLVSLQRVLDPTSRCEAATEVDAEIIRALTGELDEHYYRARHPDMAASGLDPVSHYVSFGWRLGYDPSPGFETSFYLQDNEDVRSAGINPFHHYVTSGRAEGRIPSTPNRYLRRITEHAHRRTSGNGRADKSTPPDTQQSAQLLGQALATPGRGLAFAVSHDVYTRSVGGTQIVISDEQAKFNLLDWNYLHLAPREPTLVTTSHSRGAEFQVTFNGRSLGCLAAAMIAAPLAALPDWNLGRIAIVHTTLGFASADLITLLRVFNPERSAYWVHDYASLCAGFNLLRNDISFCHAPSAESISCLVCGYGPQRAAHVAAVDELLAQSDLTILAPSHAAAEIWSIAHADRPARVHPHWTLEFGEPAPRAGGDAIRLAFIGHPFASKGWPAFQMIANQIAGDGRFRLFHFATDPRETPAGVAFVETKVHATQRFATIDNLRARQIDIVLILSPWPETFSFVAHEAVAAGCSILCLADSGNVATLVDWSGRGKVFGSVTGILDFIRSKEAAGWVAEQMSRTREVTINETGTTATVFELAQLATPDLWE